MTTEEIKEPIVEETKTEETSKVEETFKEMSPMQLILRRFFRSKLSLVGLIMIVGLFLFSFLGPVIYTAWGEEEIDYTIEKMPIIMEKLTKISPFQKELNDLKIRKGII